MVGLKWKDVDFESKTIQIRRSMEYRYSAKEWRIGEPKSKSGYCMIPLTERSGCYTKNKKKRIRGFQKFQQNGKNLCFCVEKEHQSRTVHMIQRSLKSVIKQKSQDFRCISWRHTFSTRCIEAGMKPKTLQMLLGHSNIGITMNLYVHTTEEEKKKKWTW